jgi:hypothetical protein
MSFLKEAKGKADEHKKKKHPHKEASDVLEGGPQGAPADESPEPADDAESGQESGASGGGADDESQDDAPAQAEPGGGPGAGGTADAPQAGANQPTQAGSEQGDDDDAQSGPDDQEDQQGEDDGGQSGSPDGGDTEDDTSAPGQSQAGPAGSPGAGAASSDSPQLPPEHIPPALKEAFNEVMQAIGKILYQNDKAAAEIVKTVAVPSPQRQAQNAAHMAVLLVTEVNKQLKFGQHAPQVVMPVTQGALSMVLDLAQQVGKMQISDQVAVTALGAAQEMILRVFGVTRKQAQNAKGLLPKSVLQKHGIDAYHASLAHTAGVRPKLTPGGPAGGMPAQGAQAAQPQPQPSGGMPAQGAQAAQPQPQPSGGMLAQGAQAAQPQPQPSGGQPQ